MGYVESHEQRGGPVDERLEPRQLRAAPRGSARRASSSSIVSRHAMQ